MDIDPSIILSDLSDHYPCLLTIHDETIFSKQPKRIQTRRLDSLKVSIINEKLSVVNWENDLCNQDVNIQYNLFHSKLLSILDEVAPYQTVTIPYDKIIHDPWLTPGLMKCYTKQRTLYKSSIKNHTTDNEIEKYKNL